MASANFAIKDEVTSDSSESESGESIGEFEDDASDDAKQQTLSFGPVKVRFSIASDGADQQRPSRNLGNYGAPSMDSYCPFCKTTCESKAALVQHLKDHISEKRSQAWQQHSSKLKCSIRPAQLKETEPGPSPKYNDEDAEPLPVPLSNPEAVNQALPIPAGEIELGSLEDIVQEALNAPKYGQPVIPLATDTCSHSLDKQRKLSRKTLPSKRLKPMPFRKVLRLRRPVVSKTANELETSLGVAKPVQLYSACLLKKKHECPTCLKSFANQHELAEHILKHIKDIYTCNRCARYFRSKAEWKSHMAKHPRVRLCSSFNCRQCGEQCFNYSTLKAHVKTCVPNQHAKVCLACNAILDDSMQFQSHVVDHFQHRELPSGAYVDLQCFCAHCDWDFWTREEVRDHHAARKPDISFTCSLCRARFCIRPHIDKHMAWHNSILPFRCKYCLDEVFETKSLLTQHVMEAHDALRPYNCPYCPKCFFLPSTLRLHIKDQHADEETRQIKHPKSAKIAVSASSDCSNRATASVSDAEPDLLKLVQETIQIAESTPSTPPSLPPELDFLSQAFSITESRPALGLIPRRVPLTIKLPVLVKEAQKSVPSDTQPIPILQPVPLHSQPKTVPDVIVPKATSPQPNRSPSPPVIPPPQLTRTYSRFKAARPCTYSRTTRLSNKRLPTNSVPQGEQCVSVSIRVVQRNAARSLLDQLPGSKQMLSTSPSLPVPVQQPIPPGKALVQHHANQILSTSTPTLVGQQMLSREVAALAAKFGAVMFIVLGEELCRSLGYYESGVTTVVNRFLSAAGAASHIANSSVMTHGGLSLDIYSVMRLLVSNVTGDPVLAPDSIEMLLAEMLFVMTQNYGLFTG